ncbi:hypothetical protein L207DRAFT_110390 [Hyaloscypha variabilis F]|uniref:BTB domain-containing protein n=1 Tax=Hyaloscypha variabilis (strain UAMH 11265 / GT02V1 / F) TaxID=1149755 RepID=A0A2J6R9S4_HYAVF|nr:hypothetical protein L207DRAFT_110390 [Hyaloscypha variabilis F]
MRRRPLGREIIYIKVGKEEQDFGVHKELISHYSPYFRAAFTSGFDEAKSGIMKLPETEAEIFEIFYVWLYRQKLWDKDARREDWPDTEDLVKLYVFADMARIPTLQNQALRALHNISDINNNFPYSMMDYVWANTTSSSPLRRYFLDQIVWESSTEALEECEQDFPSEVRMDIIKAMNRTLDKLIKPKTKFALSPLNKVRDYYVSQGENTPPNFGC